MAGRVVFGPLPIQTIRRSPGESHKIISETRDILTEIYKKSDDVKGRPSSLDTKDLYIDRIIRMYQLGGIETKRSFELRANRAYGALQYALASTISNKIEGFDDGLPLLKISDAVTKTALFIEATGYYNRDLSSKFGPGKRSFKSRKTEITLCLPELGYCGLIEVPTRRAQKVRERKQTHPYANTRDVGVSIKSIADGVNASENNETVVLRNGSADEDLTNLLQTVLSATEERATKEMLQHFAIARNWLNDRFAQLMPMTNDSRTHHEASARRICQWILRLFDADFVALYIFGHDDRLNVSTRVLMERGTARRPGSDANAWSRSNSEQMKKLAGDIDNEWEFSVCYRALKHKRTEYVLNWDGKRSKEGMCGFRDGDQNEGMPLPAPKSAIATPIMAYGRPWGVIEMVGFTPDQFDRLTSFWFEEACRLIGNPLFHTWLLGRFNSLNSAVLAGVNEQDIQPNAPPLDSPEETDEPAPTAVEIESDGHVGPTPILEKMLEVSKDELDLTQRHRICEHVSQMFLADGAALWLENEQWPGRYELRGHFGVIYCRLLQACKKKIPEDWQAPHIAVDDRTNYVVRAIQLAQSDRSKDANPNVVQGCVPEPVMTDHRIGGDTNGEYRLAEWNSGVRHIAIVPLFERGLSGTDQPIGAITLYNKSVFGTIEESGTIEDENLYDNRWIPYMEFAGRHVATLLRNVALEQERQNDLELMFSHGLFAHLSRIEDQYGYLDRNFIEPVFTRINRDHSLAGISLPNLSILRRAASRVKEETAQALARSEQMREEGFRMPSQRSFRSSRPWDGTLITLYNAIQDAFNSRYLLSRKRNLKWQMIGSSQFIRLRNVHPDDLRTILDNLADNAFKYSIENGLITVEVRREGGVLILAINNHGEPLTAGERQRIFMRGFRGSYALRSGQDGTGNGQGCSALLI